jgi:hypothetical protein
MKVIVVFMMRGTIDVVVRVVLAVLGGYAFSAALSACIAVVLPALTGLDRGEAVLLGSMLGFVIYLVAGLWAFATPRLGRVAVVLFGGVLVSLGLIAPLI